MRHREPRWRNAIPEGGSSLTLTLSLGERGPEGMCSRPRGEGYAKVSQEERLAAIRSASASHSSRAAGGRTSKNIAEPSAATKASTMKPRR